MDTARRRMCQTGAALLWLFLANVLPAQTPPPSPAWQNELNAARILAGAAAFGAPSAERQAAVTRAFRELGAKYPDQWEVQQAVGDHLWGAGLADKALPVWEHAQALAPGNAATADSLGSAYLRLGRVTDAAAQFQRAVDAAPANALYRFDLANVLALFRHELAQSPGPEGSEAVLIRALAEFRRAAELASADRRLAQAYAETFYMMAKPDWDAALTAWLAVRTLSGDAADFANSHLARISLKLGRPNDARGYLKELKDPAFTALREKLNANADRLSETPAPARPDN